MSVWVYVQRNGFSDSTNECSHLWVNVLSKCSTVANAYFSLPDSSTAHPLVTARPESPLASSPDGRFDANEGASNHAPTGHNGIEQKRQRPQNSWQGMYFMQDPHTIQMQQVSPALKSREIACPCVVCRICSPDYPKIPGKAPSGNVSRLDEEMLRHRFIELPPLLSPVKSGSFSSPLHCFIASPHITEVRLRSWYSSPLAQYSRSKYTFSSSWTNACSQAAIIPSSLGRPAFICPVMTASVKLQQRHDQTFNSNWCTVQNTQISLSTLSLELSTKKMHFRQKALLEPRPQSAWRGVVRFRA